MSSTELVWFPNPLALSTTERTAPRNIGTQCENIELESASDNGTTKKGIWRKENLKKYFGLGVQVSDPLLNVAKWIAYITEMGAAVTVTSPLLLYFLVIITNDPVVFRNFEAFLVFAFICFIVGLMAFCYLHFMWVKPSRHLLVGLQQLSAINFLPWILTSFIHSLPIACLYFTYMTESTNSYAWGHPPEKLLRKDLTCWDWIFGIVLCTVIITPQVIVLTAQWRVRRLSNERARNRRPSSSREPQAVASRAPLQADDERHTGPQQDVCLSSEMQKAGSLTSMLVLIFAIPLLIFGMCLNKGYSVTPFDSYFMKFWLGMSN